MFDFQKLKVYQKAVVFHKAMMELSKSNKFDRITTDQLKRASLSISLNIAEGNSRFSQKDKRNFLIIARGSAFECVAVLDYLIKTNQISKETYNYFYSKLEQISKMLFGLIRRQS